MVDVCVNHWFTGAVDEVVAAQRRLEEARTGLSVAVQRAREQGRTWADIGSVLGMSKQAAFKRFGQPVAPNGEQLRPHQCADALKITEDVFWRISQGRYDEVCALMTPSTAKELTPRLLDEVWRHVLEEAGALEALEGSRIELPSGEVLSAEESILGSCVGFVRLACEAGDFTGHITFDRSLAIIGLFIRPEALGC